MLNELTSHAAVVAAGHPLTHNLLAGNWGNGSMHGWHGGFGWWAIFPLLWLAVIVLFIVFLSRRAFGRRGQWNQWNSGQGPDGGGAVTVLRERYARGDIDEKEYRERLEVLGVGRKR